MRKPRPLTAAEFFDRAIPGATVADAAKGCRLAYSTVYTIARGEHEPRASILKVLEEWSRHDAAAQSAGVYLSASKTLGLDTKGP